MSYVLWAGLGGVAGAVLRYLVSAWAARRLGASLPWGTLIVNAGGSFLAGMLLGLPLSPALYGSLQAGLLAALTTYATFAYETLAFLEEGTPGRAALNLLLNLGLALPAAFAGWGLTQAWTTM